MYLQIEYGWRQLMRVFIEQVKLEYAVTGDASRMQQNVAVYAQRIVDYLEICIS